MAINNFKELEKLQEQEFGNPPESIRSSVVANISLFKMIGDIIELFLPKVFSLLARMTGGAPTTNVSNDIGIGDHLSDNKRPRYPNTDS